MENIQQTNYTIKLAAVIALATVTVLAIADSVEVRCSVSGDKHLTVDSQAPVAIADVQLGGLTRGMYLQQHDHTP